MLKVLQFVLVIGALAASIYLPWQSFVALGLAIFFVFGSLCGAFVTFILITQTEGE